MQRAVSFVFMWYIFDVFFYLFWFRVFFFISSLFSACDCSLHSQCLTVWPSVCLYHWKSIVILSRVWVGNFFFDHIFLLCWVKEEKRTFILFFIYFIYERNGRCFYGRYWFRNKKKIYQSMTIDRGRRFYIWVTHLFYIRILIKIKTVSSHGFIKNSLDLVHFAIVVHKCMFVVF